MSKGKRKLTRKIKRRMWEYAMLIAHGIRTKGSVGPFERRLK